MFRHGLDPARVQQTRSHNFVDLFLQRMEARSAGAGVVGEPESRSLAAQLLRGGAQSSLELVIIIGIQQVMLAVVLVVEHHLNRRQAPLQGGTVGSHRNRLAVHGITVSGWIPAVAPAAPGQVSLPQVPTVPPLTAVDQSLQSGAIGPRCRTKHPTAVPLPPSRGRQGVHGLRFIEASEATGGPVHPGHQLGESVAEQPGDPQRHIHPGPTQQRQGDHLQIDHAAGGAIPQGPHPHQGQGLGDVLASVAHRRRTPDRESEPAQVIPLLLSMQLEQQLGAAPPQVPRGLGGQTAQIDAVEVAAGG
jgi:hypothetical protein